MIYTSYYGNLGKISRDIKRVSISLQTPCSVDLHINDLKPSPSMIRLAHEGHWSEYERLYKRDYLGQFSIEYLEECLGTLKEDFVLLCFEKCDRMCHRRLVREWLNTKGVESEEYGNG